MTAAHIDSAPMTAPPQVSGRAAAMTIVVAGLGFAISAADPTILVTNIAAVRGGLGLSRSTGSFVASLANLMGAATVLGAGALGDLYGKKRMFAYGLLGSIFFGVLAAVAPTGAVLMVARAGSGAAFAFLGLALAMVNDLFPPERRKSAIALFLATGLAIIAPLPALGAWLAQQIGWRACLLIAPATAVIGLVLLVRYVPETPRAARRLDVTGLVLVAAALLGLVYGIAQLQNGLTFHTVGPIAVGLIAAGGFIYHELHTREPALDLRVFRSKSFNAAMITGLGWPLVTNGSTILFAFYLVTVRGKTPEVLGLLFIPAMALQALAATASGRAASRFGDRATLVTGLCVLLAGLLTITQLDQHSSMLVLFLAVTLTSVGGAIIQTPQSTLTMANAPPELSGAVSAIRSAICGAGASLGPALFVTVGSWLFAQDRNRRLVDMHITAKQGREAFYLAHGGGDGVAQEGQALDPELLHQVVQGAEQCMVYTIHTLSLVMSVIPLAAIVAALVLLPRRSASGQQ